MTSLQRTEKINDTVSETAATTPSNNILTESLESKISTSTLIITTDLLGNNEHTAPNRTIITTTIFPSACNKIKLKFVYNYYVMLSQSDLQYSSKLQEMIVAPLKTSNLMCSCEHLFK
jgi:hypothetical protein